MSDVIATVLHDAAGVPLPAGRPKPTSTTGQQETDLSVWALDGTETGVWEVGPGTFTATREGYHEVCQILSGRATLTHPDGTQVEIGAGDLLVTPAGWVGTWHVHETLRKVFVIRTL
ncbi:MAG: DUF861 domain-containing protein [Actinobacteria bacterium]|nr:DUF861 domain-containing protein [Actinomycetota bacterium]MCG2801629.1 cupin domain-containing protein [Cellulomonas sp.]